MFVEFNDKRKLSPVIVCLLNIRIARSCHPNGIYTCQLSQKGKPGHVFIKCYKMKQHDTNISIFLTTYDMDFCQKLKLQETNDPVFSMTEHTNFCQNNPYS